MLTATRPTTNRERHALALAAAWAVSALYTAMHLTRGWIPHDDGALAQSAERVLNGELPHRDYVELYTGGLTLLHALAFRVNGINLVSLRLVLLSAFLLWVPAVYYVASRFARPSGAALITLVAAAWSVPVYPASMPSWYNLFLATFGVAALLRFVEDGRRRWLFVAGLCGGLSFLVKISGLYFIAGALLFLVYREQSAGAPDGETRSDRDRLYSGLVTVALLLFVGLLLALVRHRVAPAEIFSFVLPGAALASAAIWREWSVPSRAGAWLRSVALLRLFTSFLAGCALPVALWLAWYARERAVGDFVRGVFLLPQRRLTLASYSMPPVIVATAVLPLAWVLAASPRFEERDRVRIVAVSAVAVALALWLTGRSDGAYRTVVESARMAAPVVALVGAVVLARYRASPVRAPAWGCGVREQQSAAVLCVAAVCTLTQFPYAAPVYFFYIAPLVLFAVCALVSTWRPVPPSLAAVMLAFYLAFAVSRVHPSAIYSWWGHYERVAMSDSLDWPRGGLRVTAEQGEENRRLLTLVSARAPAGSYIYAAPDCPQVYFMTATRNPTRSLFEFFEGRSGQDARVLGLIDSLRIPVVVLNGKSQFSPVVDGPLADSLARRFPRSAPAGRFTVRWRD